MVKSKQVLLALMVPLALTLSGCIVVTESHKSHGDEMSEWEQTEQHNRQYISNLPAETTIEKVRSQLGNPDFTDSLRNDGAHYQVLYYRTHWRKGDGVTTKDECTPLVFRDGMLIGSGELALQQVN